MNVLLVGNYENDLHVSMNRYAAFMEKGLVQAGHHVKTVRPQDCFGQLRPSYRGLGKWLGYIDKFGIFPLVFRSALRWADVVHIIDQGNSVYTKYLKSFPHLVTCHDLFAIRSALGEIPQNPTRWTGRKLQQMILKGLREAQHIVCVSDATRKDLLRVAGIPECRVSRVYNSLASGFSLMDQREAENRVRKLFIDPSQPFLLHVGGNQWYKNRLGVLRIFSSFRKLSQDRHFTLVMVGKPWTSEMRRFVAEQGMRDVAVELTGVADEDLRALYSTATLMLFPSLQEGFGWPIIEAQACGCPVLTSDRSPMNEVGGNAAVYCDPEEPESAAVIVKRALENLPSLRESGLVNASRFDSSVTINSYLLLYEKLCANTSGRCYVS